MYLDVFLRIPENTCIVRVLCCIMLYSVLYSVVCIGRVFNTCVLDVFCMYCACILTVFDLCIHATCIGVYRECIVCVLLVYCCVLLYYSKYT